MAVQNFINATDARNNFFDLLDKVKKSPYPINITVKGIPEAVIMSKEEFDGWIATIETLSDAELMKSIRQSEKDIEAGRYRDWEEIKKELGLGEKNYVSGKTIKPGGKRSQKA
ncbi:MAG: type II toxin-antitoxin system Phd/YefM family antitoxin [bacterium]|nr:type II toxin-antitoxin system Phd/YefM family antitoxin [bacterium]